MTYLAQQIPEFTSSNITETAPAWSGSTITAGAFIVGSRYTIVSVGTTNFTLIGAASNTIGVIFIATGVGAGTGTAITTYNVGDYSLLGSFVFKAVSNHTNKSPLNYEGVYWVKWQISNKWAMLDLSAQSKSYVDAGNLTVEFLQNRMGTLAIGNYEAEYVTISILDTDGTTVLWTYNNESVLNENVIDYYSYIYEPYGYQVDRAIKIVLPLWGYKVKAVFHLSGDATRTACGFLVGGDEVDMGDTLWGVNFRYNSYSTKTYDAFGSLTIAKRAVQDLVDFNTIIPTADLMNMKRNIKAIYNDIIVFIINDKSTDYENLITLGTIENASVVLSQAEITTMTFSVIESI